MIDETTSNVTDGSQFEPWQENRWPGRGCRDMSGRAPRKSAQFVAGGARALGCQRVAKMVKCRAGRVRISGRQSPWPEPTKSARSGQHSSAEPSATGSFAGRSGAASTRNPPAQPMSYYRVHLEIHGSCRGPADKNYLASFNKFPRPETSSSSRQERTANCAYTPRTTPE